MAPELHPPGKEKRGRGCWASWGSAGESLPGDTLRPSSGGSSPMLLGEKRRQGRGAMKERGEHPYPTHRLRSQEQIKYETVPPMVGAISMVAARRPQGRSGGAWLKGGPWAAKVGLPSPLTPPALWTPAHSKSWKFHGLADGGGAGRAGGTESSGLSG